LDINVVWGPGAADNAAPADFYTAVDYVVNLFDNLFTNDVAININVGYGQILIGNQVIALQGAEIGLSGRTNYVTASYSQVAAALQQQNAPGASALPATSPEPAGYTLMMPNTEAKALGLSGPSSALDASIGIGSDEQLAALGSSWDYSPTTPPTADQNYLVDTLEHEFTEAMGRTTLVATSATGPDTYSVMDLYRYLSPGVIQSTPNPFTETAYFSLDGGRTDLGTWVNGAPGDEADWYYPGPGPGGVDAFSAFATAGVIQGMSSTDLTLMAALGWTENLAVACYCGGTLISTDRGDKNVETLQVGDLVMTKSGALRPIKWIGRRSYDGRFAMGRKEILPVCIKAGAIGAGVPRRDLWISPQHAMYFGDDGGVLIEARDLVNGVSIVQAERVDSVEYFHIELDTHDVIVAEGALSETFIDDDSRGIFHNAPEFAALYPDDDVKQASYCAPRIAEGHALERVRRRIGLRAGLCHSRDFRDGEVRVAARLS
jgi:Hint domain